MTAEFLHEASCGNAEKVEKLIIGGVDINCRDADDETALIKAVIGGHIETVTVLLRFEADVNLQNKCEYTALMVAASAGYVKIVTKILYKDVNINLRNCRGETALFLAVDHGHKNIVRELIRTADKDIPNEAGVTPLQLAKSRGDDEMIRILARDKKWSGQWHIGD